MPAAPPFGDTFTDTIIYQLENFRTPTWGTINKTGTGIATSSSWAYARDAILYATSITWEIYYSATVTGTATFKVGLEVPGATAPPAFFFEQTFSSTTHTTTGMYTDTVNASANHIEFRQFFGATNYTYLQSVKALVEITSGTGSVSVAIYHVKATVNGWYMRESAYPGQGTSIAASTFSFTGTWVTDSGPPMQGQNVTIFYLVELSRNNFIWRTAHTHTNGTGAFTITLRDLGHRGSIMPLWAYISGEVISFERRLIDPGTVLKSCTSLWDTRIYDDYVVDGLRLGRVESFEEYIGPLTTTYALGTVSTDYRPRIKPYARFTGIAGSYQLPGINVTVQGYYGSQTGNTDAEGELVLTGVDPNVMQSVTVNSGLPDCASLASQPPWTRPDGVFGSPFPSGALFPVSFGIPPICGDKWWEWLALSCSGNPTRTGQRIQADTVEETGLIAVAWINSSNALQFAINTEVPDAIEKVNGTLGWNKPVTIEASGSDDIGMVYLPNKRLYLCYDKTGKKYRTNDKQGFSLAADWSSAGTPSPSVSRHSASGRGQQGAYRFRALGGTPNIWEGSGDIEFSQCLENTGAEWTTPVTAVTGARGLLCGGVWMENRWGLLYKKESDGLIYWKTTDNHESWGGGAGTQIAAIGWHPVSLVRTIGGSLYALTWDATSTKKFKIARSYDGGTTWTEDSTAIASMPPLTVPGQLVVMEEWIFLVWVVGDSTQFLFSSNGEDWEG